MARLYSPGVMPTQLCPACHEPTPRLLDDCSKLSFVNYYQIPLALLLILMMVPDGWTTDGQRPEPVAPRAA